MYERDFARRLSVHWCDLDKQEIVEAVGPGNIAGSGLVDETEANAAHASAIAKLRAEMDALATSREGWKQTALVLQELRDEAAKREVEARARVEQLEADRDALRARLAAAEQVWEAFAAWYRGSRDMTNNLRWTALVSAHDAALSALTPSPASEGAAQGYAGEWPECEGCKNDLHNGASCRKGHWHAVECKASGFKRRLPLAPAKPDTCGECQFQWGDGCKYDGQDRFTRDADPACDKGVRSPAAAQEVTK